MTLGNPQTLITNPKIEVSSFCPVNPRGSQKIHPWAAMAMGIELIGWEIGDSLEVEKCLPEFQCFKSWAALKTILHRTYFTDYRFQSSWVADFRVQLGWYFNKFSWVAETIPVNASELSDSWLKPMEPTPSTLQRYLVMAFYHTHQAVSRDLGVAVACCQYRLMCLWQQWVGWMCQFSHQADLMTLQPTSTNNPRSPPAKNRWLEIRCL